MVSFKFTRGPKVERVQFFQSSLPYLYNNAVTHYTKSYPRHWRCKEPHPSSHKILTLSNGHYGIYFTIFNHELRRKDRKDSSDDHHHVVVFVNPDVFPLNPPSEISISRVKDEIYTHIHALKNVSRDLLSLYSLLKPRNAFHGLLGNTRYLSTSAHNDPPSDPQNISAHIEEVDELPEPSFEDSFLDSQLSKIIDVFENHQSPAELNIIYPLYQSIKRNDILLPSVDHYNIVLRSILARSLDNDNTLEAIESRLTCLLTVYQDILSACATKDTRPDNTTYNLVLSGIFNGCVEAINIGHAPYAGHTDCHQSYVKSQEFCTVGTNLFLSIKDPQSLDLPAILPSLITAVNVHLHVLSKDLILRLVDLHHIMSSNGSYHVGLLDLTKHFKDFGVMDLDKKQIFDFINLVFANYKSNAMASPALKAVEFDVYRALILALIANENLPVATKFLDNILIDFKNAIISDAADVGHFKLHVSGLLSVYLEGLLNADGAANLHRAYNMLRKFDKVPYLPEPLTLIYCSLIARLIQEYSVVEYRKTTTDAHDDLVKTQQLYYNMIWALYEKVAIRKDFQAPVANLPNSDKSTYCRDYLLSLSIDLNDYSKVMRLMKEIFVNDHPVKEWNVSKKLILYLVNGAAANQNDEYLHLAWKFFNHQAQLFQRNPATLHSFLSEHVPYLLQQYSPFTLTRVLNSLAISEAFSNFKLDSHNIYGVMACSNFIVNYVLNTQVGVVERLKVLHFFSGLIREFEDTENHYLQLSEPLVQFKQTLKVAFSEIYTTLPDESYVTNDIYETCDILGLNQSHSSSNTHLPTAVDLSAILSTHQEKGVEQFVAYFNHGYNFDELTWKIMVNRNFVLGCLEKNSPIAIGDFIGRMTELTLEPNEILGLLCALVDLHNEKVCIETFKFLAKHKPEILQSTMLLRLFASFAAASDNLYFHKLFKNALPELSANNTDKSWLTTFLNKMLVSGYTQDIVTYVLARYERLVLGLDLLLAVNHDFLACILTALVENGDDATVNCIFKHYFADAEGNRILLESEQLTRILMVFYTKSGNYEMVLKHFGHLAEKSPQLKESIMFADFLGTLSGSSGSALKLDSTEGAALMLLSTGSYTSMVKEYTQIESLRLDKAQLFDKMIAVLTRAHQITGDKFSAKLRSRFEAVIKFCNILKLRALSVASLANVVRYLGVLKSSDLLNILFNKFVHGEAMASFVNFFFLHVKITSPKEQTLLLNEFKNALRNAGDDVNVVSNRLAQTSID